MKKVYLLFAVLIVILQARLLSSDGGLSELFSLQEQLNTMETSLEEQRLINNELAKEVKNLQSNPLAIETIARQNLGMVKNSEVFVRVIELKPDNTSDSLNELIQNKLDEPVAEQDVADGNKDASQFSN